MVYNHFGPDGNYLRAYSPQFFTSRHHTPWGDGINFDGPESRAVRDFFIHNALYWLEEFNFDGLRLDAVHAIVDDSTPNIITELAGTIREKLSGRYIHLVLENADNTSHYLKRDREKRVELYDAQWNDDIHHAMHVLLTGESAGYYSDYAHEPIKQLRRCLTGGFAFQGEYSPFHHANRGEPTTGLPPSAFVSFLQNHDQVGNRAFGERIGQLTTPQALRAAMEVLLLAPSPPLLFMGEEFGAVSPFLFFCDFDGELAAAVTKGRRAEFAQFGDFSLEETREKIPDPNDEKTFERSKLDWQSLTVELHAGWLHFYCKLLSIRHRAIVPLLKNIRDVRSLDDYDSEKRGLSIAWDLVDGSALTLVANLGDESLILKSTKQPRTLIYSCDQECMTALDSRQLPGWSVIWLLQSVQ